MDEEKGDLWRTMEERGDLRRTMDEDNGGLRRTINEEKGELRRTMDGEVKELRSITVEEKSEEPRAHKHKDRGWAWVISLGATIHVMLLVGTAKSFGLFFVELLEYHNTNASVLSGMLAAQNLILSLSSLFILNIGSKILGNRKLILIGGLLTGSGYLLSAFAPNVIVLIFAQSVVYGIGCACTTGPVFIVLNTYFEKHLGFANSFAYVGGSVGSLMMPVIIRSLLDSYGLKGALLVVSGLMFNNVAVGAVMRPFPPEYHCSEESSGMTDQKTEDDCYDSLQSKRLLSYDFSVSVDNVTSLKPDQICCEQDIQKQSFIKTIARNLDRNRSVSDSVAVGYNDKIYRPSSPVHVRCRNTDSTKGSRFDIYSSLQIPETFCSVHSIKSLEAPHLRDSISIDSKSETSIMSKIKRMFNLKVLRNHKLQLYLFVAFCSFCGSILIVTYIPPFASDQNISNNQVTTLVTIVGGCDLFARLTLAWISDFKRLKRHHIMGFCIGITGIAAILNPVYTSFETFVFYAVIHGLFGSVYFSMSVLVLRECVGLENMSIGMSLMITVHGLSSAIIAPLIGFIRDYTGTYQYSFYMMGSGLLLGSVAVCCMPCVTKLENNKNNKI